MHIIVPVMTEDEARLCVAAINSHMNSARAELLRLYEGRGWEALGYASWRECVVNEFEGSQSRLYQQLQAAQIEQRISKNLEIGTIPDSHLRPLARLTPIEQAPTWQRAHEIADDAGERFTARHVEQAAQELSPRNEHIMRVMGSSESPEWYTPRHILDAVLELFGEIDLDPCSNSHDMPNVPANRRYTKEDDGLSKSWRSDTLYMNPPYGTEIGKWTAKLIASYEQGDIVEALALIPGRIDTDWYEPLYAYTFCHIHGRLVFENSPYSAPFPSVVVYLGNRNDEFARIFSSIGPIMKRIV